MIQEKHHKKEKMITSNINNNLPSKTASEFYEERDNSFYLTKIATNYNQGDVFTIETPIVCRSLAFAIKAGTNIIVNGVSLKVYADAAESATQFFITATTLETPLDFGSTVTIDQKNLFLQYQDKTEGTIAGFTIDSDGIEKGGVEITGWLDSDTMTGATANNVPTAESVKAYVDANSSSSNYLFGTCSGTGLTSTTDGIANAVVVPFDTTSVESATSITLNGASGVTDVSGSAYSFSLDANTKTGVYEIKWNVSTNTDTVNNRYLCGVALQNGLADIDLGVVWETLSPSHTWLYNRGTGGNREASGSNSIIFNLDTAESIRLFRIVFWKEDGNASGKLITTTNGCGLTIKQL